MCRLRPRHVQKSSPISLIEGCVHVFHFSPSSLPHSLPLPKRFPSPFTPPLLKFPFPLRFPLLTFLIACRRSTGYPLPRPSASLRWAHLCGDGVAVPMAPLLPSRTAEYLLCRRVPATPPTVNILATTARPDGIYQSPLRVPVTVTKPVRSAPMHRWCLEPWVVPLRGSPWCWRLAPARRGRSSPVWSSSCPYSPPCSWASLHGHTRLLLDYQRPEPPRFLHGPNQRGLHYLCETRCQELPVAC